MSGRLRRLGRYAGRISVYLRSSTLHGYSHQVKLYGKINTTSEIFKTARCLVEEMWRKEPVRAMSISVSDLSGGDSLQLSMFDGGNREKAEALDRAVDTIRARYGTRSIFRGTFANGSVDPVQGGVNDGNYIMMGGYKQ